MLYSSNKKTPIRDRSKTQIKSKGLSGFSAVSPLKSKQKASNNEQLMSNQNKNPNRVKFKEKFAILSSLQEIYAGLSFNEFEAFPIENIHNAKKNIEKLYQYLGEEPICPKH